MHRTIAGTTWARLAALLLIASANAVAQTQENSAPMLGKTNEVGESQMERRIVVSLADRKLALLQNGKVVKIYRVAVGAKVSPSPQGEFTIVHRIPAPTYYAPGAIIPPGKDNPLGTRWIGLSAKGFGIHGTNQPRSIGRNLSHGCIRMRNRDAEDLFERVRVGDVVQLSSERTGEIAQIFGFAPAMVSEAAAATARAVITEQGEDGGQMN